MIENILPDLGLAARLGVVAGVAVGSHSAVLVVRYVIRRLMTTKYAVAKVRTVTSLVASTAAFAIYFCALGLALGEFGISLTAYFASASIMGLAVGFGSQGLVQDVVTGLSITFTDMFDVGDMIEVGGQTGVVRHVGMRFTVLENAMGAQVLVPNRSITNVINYPRGYVRCHCDVTLPTDPELASQAEKIVANHTRSLLEQTPAIFRAPHEIVGRQITSSGRIFMPIKFRIWPGRGAPIETGFRQQPILALREIGPSYADWMIAVNYEVERAPSVDRKAFTPITP